MKCGHCGTNEIDYDAAAGHSFCTKCGYVVIENTIVSEVTFAESATGAAVLQGSFVGPDQRRPRTSGPFRRHGSQESREQSIQNGRRKIQQLGSALKLSEHHMDAAQRYFNLAITNNFIQGRKTVHVVAACLYIVCRIEKTSHMLIDFSDILQVNVFTLGSTFLKLVRELCLILPLVDPSLYITRFASMLEFGEETQKVASDALRLVQRMDRDWMQTGRRPAGICGACLLIAARMNNFRRSVREVITVVKIADVTIKRRLEEFRNTPSGQLTVQQFKTMWLEQACDPPAFTRARQQAKEEERMFGRGRGLGGARSERSEKAGENEAVEDGIEADEGGEAVDGESESGLVSNDGQLVTEEEQVESAVDDTNIDAHNAPKGHTGDATIDTGLSSDDDDARILTIEEAESIVDQELEDEVNRYLHDDLLQSVSLTLDASEAATRRALEDSTELGSDLDDDEVNDCLLTADEVKIKTQVWMQDNEEYLKEMEAKRKKQEMDRQNGIGTTRRRRRMKKDKPGELPPSTTPAEAARRLLESKRASKKIRYEVLESLFDNNFMAGATVAYAASPTPSWRDYDASSVSGAGLRTRPSSPGSQAEEDEFSANARKQLGWAQDDDDEYADPWDEYNEDD
ncbi:8483_t:CDS:2 [Paraglomus brasilianum]|uniref:B-related factor 1 n=1 Tax=Paraglomus brasilianum TaxID=144538 RepID=A0A9N9GKD7_9GLOM|nr:8483_t:CDS:2 [Paraglomus brasilianum]